GLRESRKLKRGALNLYVGNVHCAAVEVERISKKRTKNEAKTTKPDTEWKSMKPIENPDPLALIDDNVTYGCCLKAPIEGFRGCIVVPEIIVRLTLSSKHATTGNVYRDNIQEYVSQAAAANYNQGNTGYRAPISNQIRPPGFPPAQNNHNVQNQGNNQNRYNQNRGNFNQAPAYQPPVHQGQIYRPQVVQPPAYQAPAYQAPAPQIQGVSKEDFQAYVKANDAVMRNMQTQGQNMQNQLTNLTDMLSKFVTSNTASTSGTLPSNTVTNPKEDLKGITTRSGVAYKGPTIPITSSPKVVEREPEVTKDTMPPTNNGSTEDVQPPVVPVVHHESISEPVNAPVSASRPNQKASIPFPSRRNDERRREWG
ncbi:hypothetical protein Tco_0605945, partial [Tanacetum coccineum]